MNPRQRQESPIKVVDVHMAGIVLIKKGQRYSCTPSIKLDVFRADEIVLQNKQLNKLRQLSLAS
jgi:hypothetical protein